MTKGAIITIFAALLLISASTAAASHNFNFDKKSTELTKGTLQDKVTKSKQPLYSIQQTPIWKNIKIIHPLNNIAYDLTIYPSLSVRVSQDPLVSQCENIRVNDDVLRTNCQGQLSFNVNTNNMNLRLNQLRATLLLTNTQTGYTFNVPIGMAANGANNQQFSVGSDISEFDSWNIRVCSGNLCATAHTPGTMACEVAIPRD